MNLFFGVFFYNNTKIEAYLVSVSQRLSHEACQGRALGSVEEMREFSQWLRLQNILLGEKEEEGVTVFCAGGFIFLRMEGNLFFFVSLQSPYGLIG